MNEANLIAHEAIGVLRALLHHQPMPPHRKDAVEQLLKRYDEARNETLKGILENLKEGLSHSPDYAP